MASSSSFLLILLCLSSPFLLSADEPNPPVWPDNVYVFDPADPATTQKQVDAVFAQNGGNNPPNNGQFSPYRYALLFKPGYHNVTVNVGYYTSVIGLGGSPKDTNIQDVASQNGDFTYTTGALDNFWRSAENFYTKPSIVWNEQNTPSMLWAVSQASPLRRVYVDGDLNLYQYNFGCCAGYASGGYMSNSYITGTVNAGSQQQWLTRNSYFNQWTGGGWNIVSVGCTGGVPEDSCTPYVSADDAPVISEKQFIIIGEDGKYSLAIPPVEDRKVGPSDWSTDDGLTDHTIIGFESVYVATPTDDASTISDQFAKGHHVVLTPGQYNLTSPIIIKDANMTLTGIGFPTLISISGSPCVQVADVEGVRVAGILFQASSKNTDSLLQFGYDTGYAGNAKNPGFIFDLFARVGGTNDPNVEQLTANHMARVNQGNAVIDNSWLWRADHGVTGEVYNGDNPCQTGIVVAGDNVIAYGLAVEHTLQDLTQWTGDHGKVYFYQSEFPYDVTNTYAQNGYTSYRVDAHVSDHLAIGVGAYSYFRDNPVYVESGFRVDSTSSFITMDQAITVFLNGMGGIDHVVNDDGASSAGSFMVNSVCNYVNTIS
mmetsp:Transcript_29120/g.45040  ORF Transcript_29120/g.45040 Transcript_29120/m.45040 type:complete len:598 (-) Transcript_29120:69-1862(-)|eukprot:CAMPEP_0201512012 /NCGR_PEP_ID=MMETSP0161_2-20130828/4364_1 /ASSEMBLY_ACC=CAM_ASM_000251 /TAXON_ID=180227 /ORGANISM="Neoparamoeba aestuarina, Strain SoJaBio B1-5/56/2" /LENGTH=597 /DNA_ID=CAMNT_0047907723 /DNA_START=139 /DNA_END=1932 /DNA_ORIENTATION=+